MNPPGTDWTPGLIAVGSALAAAIVFLLVSLRKHAPAAPPSSSEDLETRYQALILQLKEHAAGRHLQSPTTWAEEQARLEQSAAAVLRERAGVKHAALKAQARAEKKAVAEEAKGFLGKSPALRGALWGAGVVGFFVLLGIVLSQESTTREEGAGMTGTVPPSARGPMQAAPQQEDLKLKTAMERASRSPDDIDALSDAVRELIARQLFDDATPLIRRATALDPYHLPTRTFRAVMVAVDGQPAVGLQQLRHLADTFEGAHEARLFAGMLSLQTDDREQAVIQLEQYVNEAPIDEQPPMLLQGIAQLKADLARPRAPAPAPKP